MEVSEEMARATRFEIEGTKIFNEKGALKYILEICDHDCLNDIQKVHKVRCAALAQVEKMEA